MAQGSKRLTVAVLAVFSADVLACEQHAATEFSLNLTGLLGNSTNTTINNAIKTISADVQSISYTSTNAYIKSTGIPSTSIGPFPGNPNTPANKNYTFRIPFSPAIQSGTKTSTSLGPIGVMVNGVPFFNASDGNSYNSQGIWNQNANVVEASSFDAGMGHPAQGGTYHYHQQPLGLRNQLGDDGSHHSPLLGFAFDGFPVYGPYGYTNTDGSGGVKRVTSSYQLRNITTRTTKPDGTVLTSAQYGPAVSTTYPLGYYLEDYAYSSGSGDLDQYNGRFAVTPEFPTGTYAYFTTLDSLGKAAYPYIVGPQYYGTLQNDNKTQTVSVPTSGITSFLPSLTSSWSSATSGEWCTGSNWSSSNAPLGASTTANFSASGASPVTITLDSSQRVGTINFSTSNGYTVSGSSQLTLLSTSGSQVNTTAGNHTISVPLVMGTTTTFNIATGRSLTVTNQQGTGAGLIKTGGGTMTLAPSSSFTGTTSVSAGKLLTTSAIKSGNTLTITSGAVIEVQASGAASNVTSISALTTTGTGSRLELHDNDLILNYGTGTSSYSTILAKVKSGLTLLGGIGTDGITSSQVDSQTLQGTMLAVVDDGAAGINGAITSLSGFSIPNPTKSVLVKYTWFGDSNLDGAVNGSDYALLDSGFTSAGGLTGWIYGDFDYSGSIDGSDYALIDTGFISQSAVLPEPTTTGLLCFVMIAARRRSRS